jgi:hypothetical protein
VGVAPTLLSRDLWRAFFALFLITVLFLAFFAALVWAIPAAFARDRGQYGGVDPATRAWVKGLTDKGGYSCCDTADGYPADVDWDNDTGKYRVRIDGAWYDVPEDAVIKQPNRLGYAVVWWYPTTEIDGRRTPHIRCFLPGAGG